MERLIHASLGIFILYATLLNLIACGGGDSDGNNNVVIASYQFDGGDLQGWEATGLWHLSGLRTTTGSSSVRYANPVTDTYNTVDGGGNNITNSGTLTSPEIVLGEFPVMAFDYFLDNECNNESGSKLCFFDSLSVLISTDSGATFNLVTRTPAGNPSMESFSVDLIPYANMTVMIQLLFDTNDELSNDYEGAYVDNIQITNYASLPSMEFYIPVNRASDLSMVVPLHFPYRAGLFAAAINPNGTISFPVPYSQTPITLIDFLTGGSTIISVYGFNALPESLDSGGIYYRRNENTITIIYDNIVEAGTMNTNSFSATLHRNNEVIINYGTLTTNTALVGFNHGIASINLDETDLSTATSLSMSSTFYEQFSGGGADDSDLSNTTLTFTN